MKKILFVFGAAALMASCAKQGPVAVPQPAPMSEISFVMEGGMDFAVTKAEAVTSLESFSVIAENSVPAQVWALPSVTRNGNTYVTGKMWPATDLQYSFYASNAAMSYDAAGTTVSVADADTDIVVAYSQYQSANYRQAVPLTFNHIFARIGSVSVPAPDGYSIEVSSVKISGEVSGTYDIRKGEWTVRGSSSDMDLQVGDNDLYMVPGSSTISVTYTLEKGDYRNTFTKSGTVEIAQGLVNNITARPTLSSDEGANDIVFGVTLTEWGKKDHELNLN